MKKASGRAHTRTYQLSETVIILSHKIPVADVFQEVIISSVLVISWCRMMCKTSIEHHISTRARVCVYVPFRVHVYVLWIVAILLTHELKSRFMY